jgi:hypothetical protein
MGNCDLPAEPEIYARFHQLCINLQATYIRIRIPRNNPRELHLIQMFLDQINVDGHSHCFECYARQAHCFGHTGIYFYAQDYLKLVITAYLLIFALVLLPKRGI